MQIIRESLGAYEISLFLPVKPFSVEKLVFVTDTRLSCRFLTKSKQSNSVQWYTIRFMYICVGMYIDVKRTPTMSKPVRIHEGREIMRDITDETYKSFEKTVFDLVPEYRDFNAGTLHL